MNVCKDCKHAQPVNAFSSSELDDPRIYICKHEECIDPVVGTQVGCIDARNYSVFCGKEGKYYEEKETESETKGSPKGEGTKTSNIIT